jgi:hypothetical protein
MIDLRIKSGELLQYNESEDKVYVDGKETKEWSPTFVPNGNDEPSFFGFVNHKQKKCYDIYGGITNIHDEYSITL